MKALLIFSLLVANLGAWAQKSPYSGIDLSQIGYGRSTFTQSPSGYTPQAALNNYKLYDETSSFSIGRVPLTVEFVTDHVYVHTDMLTILSDLVVGYVKKGGTGKWVEEDGFNWDGFEFNLLRLGFGAWLNKNIGLFGGAQYAYSQMEVRAQGARYSTIVGGNQRGFGAHAFYGNRYFLLRGSFLYDWIRNSKRTFKGTATTYDISAFVPFTSDKTVGAFAGLEFMDRQMEEYNGEIPEESPYDHKETFYPAVEGTEFTFKVGFYVAGLWSNYEKTSQSIKVLD